MNSELKDELNKMKSLLAMLESELDSINIKEHEILEMLEKNGLDTSLSDLINESKKLQENITNLLSDKN